MKSILLPRPVNGPSDDPVLYVALRVARGSFLFDCGDVARLSATEAGRVTDVFLSHTHMDHFVGFDQLLRRLLGRDRRIRFWGPPGLIRQVRGKLAGYTWNLVEDYRLEIEAAEFGGRVLRRHRFTCRNRFRENAPLPGCRTAGLLLDGPLCRVRAAVIDHSTPCLAYLLEEKARINVHRERLQAEGLVVGPWLSRLKALHLEGRDDQEVTSAAADGGWRRFRVGDLVPRIASVARGMRIAWVTDASPTEANFRRLVRLVRGADLLYCEAAFLEADAAHAREKSHLTAALAGRLAREAGVGRLEIMHLSPRYQHREEEVRAEARRHFLHSS
jgi:ribonuclease Z